MGAGVVENAMKQLPKRHSKSATFLLEEAVNVLRQAPLFLLSSYYIGALPFILGLFYFWADMSQSVDARSYHAGASLGLALLYIWMKCCQAVFAAHVKTIISGKPLPRWSTQRGLSMVATQTLIHATSFFVLPIAALVAIPFGWCYAFYQNVTAEAISEPGNLMALCKRAWFQAKLWPRQNHILLAIFFIFGVVVFLNIGSAIYLLPLLLKKFLGFESIFTLSGSHMINTTFWMVAIGLTYLCMNPLVKTVYILRCFYGSALKSAADLKTELQRVMAGRIAALIGLLLLASFACPVPSLAGERFFITPQALDRSIDQVLQQREFSWRMPRAVVAEDEKVAKGPIASIVAWIVDKLNKGFKSALNWMDRLIDWLVNLLPKGDRRMPSSDENWITSVRIAVIVLLIGLLCTLIFILWRSWVRRQAARAEIFAATIESTPDLEAEDTMADDLPSNRWLDFAHELAEKGSLRLALRAFYLATLAGLAEHQLITIEKFKSNREYEMELNRRAHQKKTLLSAFSKSREIFDCVWYGMHKIRRSELDNYAAIQKRMMTIAQN
jgi:hypothetical protein